MYNDSIKLRAKTLYLQGENFEKIAKSLRKEYPKVTANTVRGWSEKGKWDESKDSIAKNQDRLIQESHSRRAKDLLEKTMILSELTFNKITAEGAPGIKSLEGGNYAFKALADLELQLRKEQNKNVNPSEIIKTFFDILNSFPTVKRELDANWNSIMREVRIRLMDEDGNGPQEVVIK